MKRIFFLFMLISAGLILCEVVYADETVIARRGDSWKSIASKYDISPEELKEANGGLAECYIGMEIVVPGQLIEEARARRNAEALEAKERMLEQSYDDAERLVNAGKLKDAKKAYDKIIEKSPSTTAYFLRGLVEYDRQKWGAAMKDLSYVSSCSDASAQMRSDARALHSQAATYKAAADAEKAQMVGQLVGMVAQTAGLVAGAVAQDKATRQSRTVTTGASRRNYSSSSTARRRATTTRGYQPRSRSTSTSTQLSSTSTPRTTSMSYQEQWNKYLSPEAFVYNYMNGLPTLPNSAQMGLTGSAAYAHDLNANLQHRIQQNDLAAMRHTQELVRQGMEAAQKEIEDFESIHGRQATSAEIQAIYQKHTQGYLDAYGTYVQESIDTSNELGLGKIDRTKVNKKNEEKDASGSKPEATTQTSREHIKTDKTEKKEKASVEKENSSDDENDTHHGRYIQKLVTIHNLADDKVLYAGCKVFEDGPVYYVLVNGAYHKVSKSTKPKYRYKIVIGHMECYFNM